MKTLLTLILLCISFNLPESNYTVILLESDITYQTHIIPSLSEEMIVLSKDEIILNYTDWIYKNLICDKTLHIL